MKKSLIILFLLCGCAIPPQQRLAMDKTTCASYGFHKGTDAFANCMMQLVQVRNQQSIEQQQSAAMTGQLGLGLMNQNNGFHCTSMQMNGMGTINCN